jgi:hypothetical protein
VLVARLDDQGVDAVVLTADEQPCEHDPEPAVAAGSADEVLRRRLIAGVDRELLGRGGRAEALECGAEDPDVDPVLDPAGELALRDRVPGGRARGDVAPAAELAAAKRASRSPLRRARGRGRAAGRAAPPGSARPRAGTPRG